ncbi:MAG: radical SAM protein [archaeon]
MKLRTMLNGGIGFAKAKLFGKKIPLVVGMALTNKCNLKCEYCNISSIKSKEMTTNQVLQVIDLLADSGCIRIGFTGGEPLLRKDIKEIIEHCKEMGIESTLTTNGVLIENKLSDLKDLSLLIVSIDGNEKVNDCIRGKNSFKMAKNAVTLAKKSGLHVALSTVVSKANKDQLKYLFDFSKEPKSSIHFQFVSGIPLTANNISKYLLSNSEKKEIVSRIIEEKKINPLILNSRDGLNEMATALSGKRINSSNCAAGRIFFRVSTEGKLYSCWRQKNKSSLDLTKLIGKSPKMFENELNKLSLPECASCEIADGIELSLVNALNPKSVLNVFLRY